MCHPDRFNISNSQDAVPKSNQIVVRLADDSELTVIVRCGRNGLRVGCHRITWAQWDRLQKIVETEDAEVKGRAF